ncbi:MAG: S8 family peptidase [Rhodocyclaceae bacterium]|nr:S8 family peptidase [Rhodocyclaceae bacterium]
MNRKTKIAIAVSVLGVVGTIGATSLFWSGSKSESEAHTQAAQVQQAGAGKSEEVLLVREEMLNVALDVVSDRMVLRLAENSELLQIMQEQGSQQLEIELNKQLDLPRVNLVFNKALSDFGDDLFLFSISGERLDRAAMDDLLAAIANIPGVVASEEDVIVSRATAPNDPQFGQQWNLGPLSSESSGIDAEAGWAKVTSTLRPVLAVVDTGVTAHSDLQANLLPGYNFISSAARAGNDTGRSADAADLGDWVDEDDLLKPEFAGCELSDSSWHGTHVAGIAAAASDNGMGIAGVSPRSQILPVRVLGKCGGYATDIAAGILWAAGLPVTDVPANPNPAKVINMSLGASGSCPSLLNGAIKKANASGALVVVAAGNNNVSTKNFFPANCAGVLPVTATTSAGDRASYSNFGGAIAAPGGQYSSDSMILSTVNAGTKHPAGDAYAAMQGTSMAAPHVAGLAALIAAAKPTLNMSQVRAALLRSAKPFAPETRCAQEKNCGVGIISAGAAVEDAVNTIPNLYADKIYGGGYFVPGVPTDIKLTIGNSGATAYVGETKVRIYLSGSEVLNFDQNPILIAEINPTLNLSPLRGRTTLTIPVNVEQSVESGTYYLIAKINPDADDSTEKTLLDNEIDRGQVEVVRPEFEVTIKKDTDQVPSTFRAVVTPTNSKLTSLTRQWTFQWDGMEGIENAKARGPELRGTISTVGNNEIKVAVSSPNGAYNKEATGSLETRDPDPMVISFGIRQSNKYGRAPLSVIVAPSVKGGHPSDRIVSGKIFTGSNDTLQESTKSRAAFIDLPAGDHVITYNLKTKQNREESYSETITVIPNIAPSCSIVTRKGEVSYYFSANCTDEDGRIRGYAWKVNGESKLSTSNRLIVPFDNAVEGQIAVELVGKDDSGDTATANETVQVAGQT